MRYALIAALLLIAAPAMAGSNSYETPEYSGQTPKFDKELDRYRDTDSAIRASKRRLYNIRRDQINDTGTDNLAVMRAKKTQEEMLRRREEAIRANKEQAIRERALKTNQ